MPEFAAASTSSRVAVFHRSFFAMNTRLSMVLVGIDREKAEALATAAEHDVRTQEWMMSRFAPEGPVAELNRRAALEAVKPPGALWEILMLCREYGRRTGGTFDITMRPLQELWRASLERGEVPGREAIAQGRFHTGIEHVCFDEKARTIRFESEGMSIDLGGFGKGFALDRLAGRLRAQGVEQALLSFGESSITVLGAHPHGPSWPVGIAHLFTPSQTVHRFDLKDASLSSSGTAPFNQAGGQRAFGQIVDPRTGRPVEGYRTMSVACGSATEAEVLSTALLLTPEQDRAALLKEFPVISAVEIVYHEHNRNFVPSIQWDYGL